MNKYPHAQYFTVFPCYSSTRTAKNNEEKKSATRWREEHVLLQIATVKILVYDKKLTTVVQIKI